MASDWTQDMHGKASVECCLLVSDFESGQMEASPNLSPPSCPHCVVLQSTPQTVPAPVTTPEQKQQQEEEIRKLKLQQSKRRRDELKVLAKVGVLVFHRTYGCDGGLSCGGSAIRVTCCVF